MSSVVFLGPSLPAIEAKTLVDATILPPCKMGDVFAVAQPGTRAIAIIDGYFESTPAVWHKEILHAMSQGIVVFGGASMGALRAAELHTFGMIGVGRIFDDFATGVLEDDDEVAVSHFSAEHGYRCRSEAMVNIRHGLRCAREAGVISLATEKTLVGAAKATHYTDRSWRGLLEGPCASKLSQAELDALRGWLSKAQPNLKREDAIEVLTRLRAWSEGGRKTMAAPTSYQFEPTIFWEHLCRFFGSVSATGTTETMVRNERLIHHARFLDPARKTLQEKALLLLLAEQESRRLGLGRPDPRVSLERFRRDRGLTTSDSLADWMTRQGIHRDECLRLATAEATLRRLLAHYAEQVDAHRGAALRLEGRFDRVHHDVTAKWRDLAHRGIESPGDEDVESLAQVLEWYQREYGPIHTSLEQHLTEWGFGSPRQFLEELYAEYLYRRGNDGARPCQ